VRKLIRSNPQDPPLLCSEQDTRDGDIKDYFWKNALKETARICGKTPIFHTITMGIAVFVLSISALGNPSLSNAIEVFYTERAPQPVERLYAVNLEASQTVANPRMSQEAGETLATGGTAPQPTLLAPQDTALLGPHTPPSDGTFPAYGVERREVARYTVQDGDTLSSIAAAHNLRVSTLLWSNDLGSADLIHPGDELNILPTDGVLHLVQPGETVSSIAITYEADMNDILSFNDIEAALIIAGQTLVIPGGTAQQRTSTASTPYIASNLPFLSGYFQKPAAGTRTQGLHSFNAVDIGNSCGTSIYAAASGTVRIASGGGRWNGGYGNFIVITHANGTETLYAHLSKVVVVPGERVAQGEIISYMGSTGRSTGCHVHWEVRGAQNPLG
jgi:murein DD-endopeptidase MepM/ murein hydrolase activator NlpD